MREIQRISITDAVVDNIKEMIENKEFQVGEKLPAEAKFCEMFGVSRTSVREAFRVLQALGYVENRPGKGAFVAANHIQDTTPWYEVGNAQFTDFMEVRMAIETLAVRLAVERADDNDIKELEEVHESFLQANENKDMVRLIMLDELFHTKIIKITKNQLLININSQLVEAFRVYRSESFTNQSVYKNAVGPHSRILECFRNHDPSQAMKEMRKHLEITEADMAHIHSKKSGEENLSAS